MRVAIIATRNLPNFHLCVELARQNDVVAVFHPMSPRASLARKAATFAKKVRRYGLIYTTMVKAAGAPVAAIGWSSSYHLKRAEKAFFANSAVLYEQQVAPIASDVTEVNSVDFIRRLRDARADVVICSGGPVYRQPLIDAAGLMLNYHTGISPIYNGSHTILWAYANGHVHLCGGTLMVMNAAVDGGDMLAHYFPPLEPGDDPADLFCKAIIGGARLYNEFLGHLRSGALYQKVRQPRPFFYYRADDWTIYQNLQVERRRAQLAQSRPEQIVRYWKLGSQQQAEGCFRDQLVTWIGQQRPDTPPAAVPNEAPAAGRVATEAI